MAETTQSRFGFFSDKTVEAPAQPERRSPLLIQARKGTARTVLPRAELAGGKVVVKAPRGYCIDAGSLRKGVAGGFALVAACNSLTGDFSGADAEPAVMTVQVQPGLLKRELPSAEAVAAVLAPARALKKIDGDGLTLVHMDGGGDGGLPAGDPKHWRGALRINGYMVGLALYAPKGHALAGPRGEALILRLAENMLDASPIPDFAPSAAAPQPKNE